MVDLTDYDSLKDLNFFINSIFTLAILEISILVSVLFIFVDGGYKYLFLLFYYPIIRLIRRKIQYKKICIKIAKDKLEIRLIDFEAILDKSDIKSVEEFTGKPQKVINWKKEFVEEATLFLIINKSGLAHIRFSEIKIFKLRKKQVWLDGIVLNLTKLNQLKHFIGQESIKTEIPDQIKFDSAQIRKPSETPLVINAKDVEKSYYKKKFMILSSFQLFQGDICGLIGENGAGKTTLIKILMMLTPKDKGVIEYFGRTIHSIRDIAKQVGYVPDIPVFYDKFTVKDYFDFIGKLYEIPQREFFNKVKKLTNYFHLEDFKNQFICNLSLGLKKKLSILVALLHDPQLILMDEPLIGLDPDSQWSLMNLITDLQKEGKTILVSSHTLEVLEKISTNIVILKNGHVVFSGVVDHLKQMTGSDSLLESYMRLIR